MRVVAVEADADTRQIEVVVAPEKHAGRVAEAARHAGKQPAHVFEPLQLARVVRRSRLVCTGEMAHDQRNVQRPAAAGIVAQRAHFRLGHTQAVDSALDVQRHRHGQVRFTGGRQPGVHTLQIVQARYQAVGQQDLRLHRDQRGKHIDVDVAQKPAQRRAFRRERHEKRPASGSI